MSRYIDADALKDILVNKMQERYDNCEREYGYYDQYVMGFGAALELLKSAHVEQGILHGHWIGLPISGYADCKCSICGAVCNVHASAGIPTQRYCYRCGALMLEDK